MDFSTLIGLAASFCLVGLALLLGGDAGAFVNAPAILIVFGGCLGAILTNYSPRNLAAIVGIIRSTIRARKTSSAEVVDNLLSLSIQARKDGLASLEAEIDKISCPFLAHGVQLTLNGLEPATISRIMENEIEAKAARELQGADLLNALASYAPALGLVGTVIGLVQMLNRMTDPSQIGASMAVALITTFYGVILANLVFLPIGGKFRQCSRHQIRIMEMQVVGVLAISRGENPNVLKDMLESFQSDKEKGANTYR